MTVQIAPTQRRPLVLAAVVAALLLVAGSAVFAALNVNSGPVEYRIMVTEPSSNMTDDGQLLAHWSCDPRVDPETRYQGTQDAMWVDVDGSLGDPLLTTTAACQSGSLLTVQVDAGIVELYRATELRCEVFDQDGQRVADERVTRGLGTSDPVCRVPVP